MCGLISKREFVLEEKVAQGVECQPEAAAPMTLFPGEARR